MDNQLIACESPRRWLDGLQISGCAPPVDLLLRQSPGNVIREGINRYMFLDRDTLDRIFEALDRTSGYRHRSRGQHLRVRQ
jgi:hypothetical protein